jgi:outer membrane protein assembly factor BamB
MSSLSGYLPVLVVLVGCAAAAGCAREPSAQRDGAQPKVSVPPDLVVLPNNTALYTRKDRLLALRREGDIMWEAVLPANDTIAALPAVGLNSVAYVRGVKALHALLPDGKWAWSKPLDGLPQAATPATSAPVTFPDSTVAVVVGSEVIRFDENGAVRWKVSIPEGNIATSLRAGMDGALFVPTSAGLYCLSPEGSISWRRVLGN